MKPINLSQKQTSEKVEDVAIIGMAARYPDANNLDEFWDNLKAGKDSITQVPESRWPTDYFAGITSPSGKALSTWGGFINDPDRFDSQFFRISPWEAKLIDPQQRLFLEVCWETMENAGYTPQTLVTSKGRNQRRAVGVYVGVMHNDYAQIAANAVSLGERIPVSLNVAQIANRVSYFCNFHGPSIAIDTVCSSSLIAVHLALESIQRGESEVALAGGVNLSLHPNKYMTYGMMDMHSSDGRCRAFGADGDGYVSSEGIGAVLLKPLNKAIADNDTVYAIIKGSTTNHVGAVSGLTVPSPVAQADMIEACLEKTGIHPRTISYVEAHGTGTSLGDPIEVQGLSKAFGHFTEDKQFCSIGSVKSNIGHAESAAGISGLNKLVLQLHHKTLVPSLHSATLNPYLDFENSPFFVQHETEAWQQPVVQENGRAVIYPRRAALSSFGASGSNAHVILEEYIPSEVEQSLSDDQQITAAHIIPLSARNQERLSIYADRVLQYLQKIKSTDDKTIVNLSNIAHTLQIGREAMKERVAFVASNIDELMEGLQHYIDNTENSESKTQTAYRQGSVKKGKKGSQQHSAEEVDQWLVNNKSEQVHEQKAVLVKVAQAWALGTPIDWNKVYANINVKRIALPTYPFAKDRHWLDIVPAVSAVENNTAPTSTTKTLAEVKPNDNNTQIEKVSQQQDRVYYSSRWEAQPLTATAQLNNEDIRAKKISLFVATNNVAQIIDSLNQLDNVEQVIQLALHKNIAQQLHEHTLALFHHCQNADRIKHAEPELLLVYVPYTENDFPYRSLMGGLRTISLEFPFIQTKLVFDSALAFNDLANMQKNLKHEIQSQSLATEVLYIEQEPRQVLVHESVQPVLKKNNTDLLNGQSFSGQSLIRENGVYLITGGLGGLGRLFAETLGKGTHARFILTGRSMLTESKKALITELKNKGLNIDYYSCDTSKQTEVQKIIQHVLSEYGALHGVIHSAGLIADNFIPKKTDAEISDVLSAKVDAILNLDEATKAIDLDFFVAFSSVAALGNMGQYDYATANAFLDAFAIYRNKAVIKGERKGKSVSINWPLWKEGGMTVDPAYEKFMFDKFGIVPLEQSAGINAFFDILQSDYQQIGVMEGDGEKITRLINGEAAAAHIASSLATKKGNSINAPKISQEQQNNIEQIVLAAIADALGMDTSSVDAQTEFVDYGMDSISATKVANYLNQHLGLEYTGAIFLELDTAEKLIEHLQENIKVEEAENSSDFQSDNVEQLTIAETTVSTEIVKTQAAVSKIQGTTHSLVDKIAIIGFDGRFPEANSGDEYWRNLSHKKISTNVISKEKWQTRGITFDDNNNVYNSMRHSALIENIDQFDPGFWNIDHDAAIEMDPQQRLLLQSIWHCVENAGYSMQALAQKKVGLFLAIDSLDYRSALRKETSGIGMGSGISVGMIANQISYYCDFRGPSEVIDNACASTYVAIKKASQAMASGECDIAIVGGAKILLDPIEFMGRDQGEILSRSSTMHPFDVKADGYIRGEGLGCVLLKPLEAATEAQDTVHAVIAGVGISHNGSRSLSQIAPSVEGQYQAIKAAYSEAKVSPETVNYIEAHGTANNFSDSAEISAFKQFFKESMDEEVYRNHRCAISTVKGNTGHLEGASGIASLIKAICALKHKKIAPIATLSDVHPSILLKNSPFYFPLDVTDWEKADSSNASVATTSVTTPRRVGLHSIGIGGVNAHLLLEEPIPNNIDNTMSVNEYEKGDDFELIVLSAKSEEALDDYRKKWQQYLLSLTDEQQNDGALLSNIAYSSQVSREAMPYRITYVVNSIQALINLLDLLPSDVHQYVSDSIFVAENINQAVIKDKKDTLSLSPAHSLDGLTEIAKAWLDGYVIDWKKMTDNRPCHKTTLPNYPFQNRSVWYEQPTDKDSFADLFYKTFTSDVDVLTPTIE